MESFHYEEALHSTTKDKLAWSSKEKDKLRSQLAALESSYSKLEEKHMNLDKQNNDALRELRDVEYTISQMNRGERITHILEIGKMNVAKIAAETAVQVMKTQHSTNNIKNKPKVQQNIEYRLERLEEKNKIMKAVISHS